MFENGLFLIEVRLLGTGFRSKNTVRDTTGGVGKALLIILKLGKELVLYFKLCSNMNFISFLTKSLVISQSKVFSISSLTVSFFFLHFLIIRYIKAKITHMTRTII